MIVYFQNGRFKLVTRNNTMTTKALHPSWNSATVPSFKSWWTWTNGMKLSDGSNYTGNLDRFGRRIGFGTWRSPSRIYDYIGNQPQLSWTEYYGEWRNDKPNGFGEMRNIQGDGTVRTTYEGEWINGTPISSAFCGLSTST